MRERAMNTTGGAPLRATMRAAMVASVRATMGATTAALLLGIAACGGGEGGGPGGGSPTNPDNQPPMRPLVVDGTLGTSLGDPNATGGVSRIVEAVPGLRHTCARDDQGGVWCWGDPPREDETAPSGARAWPLVPTRVANLPPIVRLAAPRWYPGENGAFTLPLDQASCGQAADERWYCWGEHPENPLQDRQNPVTGVLVQRPGVVALPTELPPLDVLNQLDAARGTAYLEERLCGVSRNGRLLCWPGFQGTEPEEIGAVPNGVTIDGECALSADGAVRCSLPLFDGPPCALGLRSMIARGGRACGERADGTWRCYGRRDGAERVELADFVDVDRQRDCGR